MMDSFLSDCKCRGGYRTAAKCKMELFVTVVYDGQPVISIVTRISILNFAATLDPLMYVDILCASSRYSEWPINKYQS